MDNPDKHSSVSKAHLGELIDIIRSGNRSEAPDRWLLAPDCGGAVEALDASRYTDEALVERERQTLFREYPLVLECADRIPAGQCLAHDGLGIPLLITNDGEKIRVFLNQCRHRGTRLLSGDDPCEKRHIVCPYHNWAYRLDGALHSLPQAEGFPGLVKDDRGLIELPSAVRGGLLFCLPKPGASFDVDDWLGKSADYLDEMQVGEWHHFKSSNQEYACNWKLPIDAFLEAYHIYRLHKETLAPLFEDNLALGRQLGWHSAAAVARRGIVDVFDQPESAWDVRNHVTFSLYLMPNTVLIFHPDYTSVVRFFPLSAGRCRIDHSMLIPELPKNNKAKSHWQRAFHMTDRKSFAEEDFHICEEIQLGLSAGGDADLVLGNYEKSIAGFHKTLGEMIAACSQ